MSGDASYTFNLDRGVVEREAQLIMARKAASLTRRISAQAKANVPVKTGNLGRSIQEDPLQVVGMTVRTGVTATADYAAMVHDGTRPHIIRPRSTGMGPHPEGAPGALKFQIGGRTIFARSVRHPGTKPRPFLKNAMDEVMRQET